MSTEENKAIVRRFIEPWQTGNVDALDDLVADNYTLEGSGTINDLKQAIRTTRAGLPDLRATIDEMIAEGDKVAYRWTMTGTHQGELEGIAATGKTVTATGITIVRIENGKIVEDHFESGSPSTEQQVGSPAGLP